MLFASVYASIVYFITEQPPEPERFLKFVLVFMLLACVADGFGTFLGTVVNPIVSVKNFNQISINVINNSND